MCGCYFLFQLLKIKLIYLFMARLGFCRCTRAFSSCGEWRLSLWLHCVGFSSQWLLLLKSVCSRVHELGSCVTQPVAPRGWVPQLWRMGLVALRHVESSRRQDWTLVPWFDRQILHHWTTKEVLLQLLNIVEKIQEEKDILLYLLTFLFTVFFLPSSIPKFLLLLFSLS